MKLTGVEDVQVARAATFVQSELFARTFREGMALVEETANYLDGAGREASKTLHRTAAISYASASMRLTTQLMQIASWLLVLRAVRESEMELAEAADKKYRIEYNGEPLPDFASEGLPEQLVALIQATHQLFARITRLDTDLFSEAENDISSRDAAGQQRALMKAFNKRS